MLGERIRYFRKQIGLSQEEIAQKLHIVRQTVSKWEKGQSVPDADMLVKLASLFCISVNELLTDMETASKNNSVLEERCNLTVRYRNTFMGARIGLYKIGNDPHQYTIRRDEENVHSVAKGKCTIVFWFNFKFCEFEILVNQDTTVSFVSESFRLYMEE